jgi:hypothetical protein
MSMTLNQKLKAINKILPIQAIWYDEGVLGIQFKIPKNMQHINPMFQGGKTVTFAYFNTLENCINNEYKRVVLKKKVRGGLVCDVLIPKSSSNISSI